MKYCFNYSRRGRNNTLLDEINIKFDPEDMELMFDYMLEHKHQRINAKKIVDKAYIHMIYLKNLKLFKDE